ncbi:hypothetical protein [Nocardia sp. CNY236]|uniref:hypothetical protein n=1 Tax=Nocardia sp. CNY236 TaxID=1169152 RepID=UPI000416374E|nr:hypothetical protein [Nocardia sp. CNY236]
MLAHTDATLRSDIDTLETAYEIIELRKPVAAASRKGISWQGPLHAERIVDLAKIANDDDVDYYTQWRRNVESIAQRAAIRDEDLKHRCGRPTKTTKSPCSNRPVYVPGRGHAGGLGCTRHLTAVEREVVARYFYDAVAHHDCPGCVAESGIACFTDGDDPRKLRSVDGAWPPTRAFAGEEVHTARLDRVQL